VNPGDLVVADEIGVVVVPKGDMEKVYEAAKAQAEKEELTRKEILKGASFEELLKKFGRL
jgi:regulator of RNase E activity RraA